MVFDRRRRRAHSASTDARLSTGYARAIDSLETSDAFASMRSMARWVGEIRPFREGLFARVDGRIASGNFRLVSQIVEFVSLMSVSSNFG
jgi:hypothetical protein